MASYLRGYCIWCEKLKINLGSIGGSLEQSNLQTKRNSPGLSNFWTSEASDDRNSSKWLELPQNYKIGKKNFQLKMDQKSL